MRRQTVGLVSSTLLLPFAVFLATTGLVSDFMDLNEFVYHKYTGYISAGLALLHVYAYWPQLMTFWGLRAKQRPRMPVQANSPGNPSAAGGDKSQKEDGLPLSLLNARLTRREALKLAGAGAAGLLVGWLIRRPADAISMVGQDLGLVYHRWSVPGYADAISAALNWGRQPPLYKDYAWAQRLPLPPIEPPAMLLLDAISRRRSMRDYSLRPMTLAELSWSLYCASGITAPAAGLRSAPSAGAQFPIETYLVVNRIEGLPAGIYHYAVAEHALESLRQGEFGPAIMRAALGQEFLAQAGVVFVLTSIFQRLRWRYRERAYRYALLEAGHIGQNIYLAAESAGLGACAVGSYLDDEVNQLLEVDGEQEAALYLLAVGPR